MDLDSNSHAIGDQGTVVEIQMVSNAILAASGTSESFRAIWTT